MFEELKEIIKTDSESQEKFKSFRVNFSQKQVAKAKTEKRRARTTSFILASSAIVSLTFLFYAFTVQTQANELQEQVDSLELKLQNCSDK